jgi:hypothetical protein
MAETRASGTIVAGSPVKTRWSMAATDDAPGELVASGEHRELFACRLEFGEAGAKCSGAPGDGVTPVEGADRVHHTLSKAKIPARPVADYGCEVLTHEVHRSRESSEGSHDPHPVPAMHRLLPDIGQRSASLPPLLGFEFGHLPLVDDVCAFAVTEVGCDVVEEVGGHRPGGLGVA